MNTLLKHERTSEDTMADKSWMLNPKAIRHANECIHIIKELEGVRLKLSQPDFLPRLHEYVEQLNSRRLGDAYAELLAMAGVGNVLQTLEAEPAHAVVAAASGGDITTAHTSEETVKMGGQTFPRFRNGREFRGLYRGVPRYR